MDSAVDIHRLHFAFTITFHYLFPQLTMGLALLIVVLKSLALWKGDDLYNKAARFWGRIFALNFAMGVVTGLPIEFQFGQTGQPSPKAQAASLGKHWRWKGSSRSSSSRRFWVYFFSVRSGSDRSCIGSQLFSFFSDRGCRGFSSLPPMRGCSIRSDTRPEQRGSWFSRAFGSCCRIRGSSGNTRTP